MKAKTEARILGAFTTVQALYDTCASRPVVERDSRLLLSGRARKRAIEKNLYYRDDAQLYDAVKGGEKAWIKTMHSTQTLTEEHLGVICMRVNGTVVHAIAIIAEKGRLPAGTELIVDADTLRDCKVDINAMLADQAKPNPDHPSNTPGEKESKEWEGFIEDMTTECRTTDETSIQSYYVSDLTDEVYLSEIKCKTILQNNPEIFKPKSYNAKMVEINSNTDELPKEHQKRLHALVSEFHDTFAGANTLPNPMRNQPAAHFLLREGAEPTRCPKPRWGPSQEQLLLKWARASLATGLIEPASPNCPYANRPHVVEKSDHEARVTGDFVKLNENIIKRPGNLPNMEDELRRHRGAKYFTLADAAQGYYQLELDHESRQLCALWTPLGLMVPTRLWMGPKNAGSIYQTAVTSALGTMPEQTKKKTSNYMDDFLVSGTEFETYFDNTREFFKMCRANGITLNPAKTKLGFKSAKMLGREITGERIYVHSDNLKALRDCREPTDVPQLKSFLGICAYARKHVKDFAFHAECLHNLTRKGVPWHWPKATKDAFLRLKSKVLENFQLHVPDEEKPFYLFTDASDLGMGAHLCQLRHPVEDSELHTVKDEDKLTIAFYSSSFDLAMQQKPVYYREARAMIWGLEKSKEFLERAHLETVVVTDHAPLQWIKSTNKGAVSAWLIESVADPDYRVVYMPGSSNTTADALSRPPLVSPSKLTLLGAADAWDAMLKLLPVRHMHCARVHVWAAQHTSLIQRKVQAWRHPSNVINVRAPKSMLDHCKNFDLILSAPAAEEGPIVAHQILKRLIEAKSDATFACLLPTELISFIPSAGGDPKSDPELRKEIQRWIEEETTKIVFAQTNFTWLIFNKNEKGSDKVITNFMQTSGTEFDQTSTDPTQIWKDLNYPVWDVVGEEEIEKPKGSYDTKVYGNFPMSELKSWVEDQQKDAEITKKFYQDQLLTRDDGLVLIATSEGNKVYVPSEKRQKLVIRTHREMGHGLIKRIRKVLTDKYIWPKMIKDILTWVAECPECPLAKAKKNIKHNLYSPSDHRKPRSAYGVDFYGIAKSHRGNVGVLTVTDLFTRWVNYIPVKNTTADAFAQALMERVVFERGAFKILVSDGANAFVGSLATQLAALLKLDKVETFYYPQGNSITERHHVLIGEFLRLLPADKRDSWDEEIGAAAYAANMCENSSTGFSAFQLDCGFQPSAPADLMFQGHPIPTFDTETFVKTTQEQKEWLQRIKDIHKIARECDLSAKEISIQRLNNPKRASVILTPGDKVLMYIPAQPKKGENAWKAKHLTHWRRATVIEKKSSSTYLVKDAKGKSFIRSISLLNKDHSTVPQDEPEVLIVEEKFYDEGSIIAIKDESPEGTFGIAQVLKVSENGDLQVKHFGTVEKQQKKATFKPIWADENERIKLSTTTLSKRYKALTGIIRPSQILQEVILTDKHHLSSDSAKELYETRNLQRNVLKTIVVSKSDHKLDTEFAEEDQKIQEEVQQEQQHPHESQKLSELEQVMQRWKQRRVLN